MAEESRKAPGWVQRLVVVGLWSVLAFGALELSARSIFFPEWVGLSPHTTGDNPYFGVFTLPNLSIRRFSPANYDVVNTTNRFGFRDRDKGFERDLDGVWIFGDSNTFGMGIADGKTYSALLDAAGIPTADLAGLGEDFTRDRRILTRLTKMGYRPKAVLMVLSMNYSPVPPPAATGKEGNTRAVLPAELFRNKLSRLARPDAFSFLGIKSILLRNFALYGFVKTALVSVPAIRESLRDIGVVQDVDLRPSGPIWMTDTRHRDEVKKIAGTWAERLAHMRDEVRNRFGAPFAVVLLPTHHHLYPARFKKLIEHFHLDAATEDAAQPYDALEAALAARHVTTIDVLSALRATYDPQLIFFNDGHFNAKGHRVIASVLETWLRKKAGQAGERKQ